MKKGFVIVLACLIAISITGCKQTTGTEIFEEGTPVYDDSGLLIGYASEEGETQSVDELVNKIEYRDFTLGFYDVIDGTSVLKKPVIVSIPTTSYVRLTKSMDSRMQITQTKVRKDVDEVNLTSVPISMLVYTDGFEYSINYAIERLDLKSLDTELANRIYEETGQQNSLYKEVYDTDKGPATIVVMFDTINGFKCKAAVPISSYYYCVVDYSSKKQVESTRIEDRLVEIKALVDKVSIRQEEM